MILAAVALAAVLSADRPVPPGVIAVLEPKGQGFAAEELKPFGRAFTMTALVKPELPVVHDVREGSAAKWGAGWWAGVQLMVRPLKTGGYTPLMRIGRKKIGPVMVEGHGSVLAPGRWVRLTGVCDGRCARLYVDGRLVASAKFDTGWNDAEFDMRFCVGNTGFGFAGYPAHPMLCDSAAIWDRPLSPAEVAALPHDAVEADTPEIADFFRLRDARGRKLTPAALSAWRAGHLVSPRCAQALDELETVVLVACGDIDGAARKFKSATLALEAALRNEREPITPSPVSLFRERYLAALEDYAPVDAAIAAAEEDCREVEAGSPTCLPMARARLAKLYRRAGRTADAERMERLVLGSDLRLYPQLAAKFGRSYSATASAADGARVADAEPSTAFYVSPGGDDGGDGSAARPFATLLRARDAVRALARSSGLPAGGVAVRLRGGTYRVDKTLSLVAADSGAPGRPVVWEACPGERPVLSGAFRFRGLRDVTEGAVLARLPAAACGRVKCFDLRAAGYPFWNVRMPKYGRYATAATMNDLYEDGNFMTTARYPNEGEFLIVKSVPDSGRGVVAADIPDMGRWAAEPDLMAMGYWEWFWADHGVPVTNVCPADGTLALDVFVNGRSPFKEMRAGQTFFLENALLALDSPGEWYHDCRTGMLYVWPRRADATYAMTAADVPLVSLDGVHDVRIEGLVFEYGRRDGVVMNGCRDVVFAGNVVRNFGWNGVSESKSRNMTFADNVFRSFGSGPLRVGGGERRSLTPSGIKVTNNELSHGERRRRTYCPLVHVDGVGIELSFNHMHDNLSSAVRVEGNDHYIVSNLVERVVLEADDEGGLDIYNNSSYFGNRYCWNVWKDIGSPSRFFPRTVAGVRFDGNISGQQVFANRFIRCGTGSMGSLQSCGGRMHVIDNNLIIDGNRGMSVTKYALPFWTNEIRRLIKDLCLKEVDVTKPPFSTRYPGIENILETNQVNHFTRNIVVGQAPLLVNAPADTVMWGNRHYMDMPDLARLARDSYFAPVPDESDVGPRRTKRFEQARKNDKEDMP